MAVPRDARQYRHGAARKGRPEVPAARFVCDYLARGANAGDLRSRFTNLLGKHLKPTGMEVENLAMIRVDRAQWPLPTKEELNSRWKPAPGRASDDPVGITKLG